MRSAPLSEHVPFTREGRPSTARRVTVALAISLTLPSAARSAVRPARNRVLGEPAALARPGSSFVDMSTTTKTATLINRASSRPAAAIRSPLTRRSTGSSVTEAVRDHAGGRTPGPARGANLALRFGLELGARAALAFCGFHTGRSLLRDGALFAGLVVLSTVLLHLRQGEPSP